MKKLNYREIFIIVMLIIVLLVVLLLCFTKKSTSNKNVLSLETKKSNLEIKNSLTMSYEMGKNKEKGNGYSNFIIKADKLKDKEVKYEIYLKQINSVNSINPKYIKLYLTEKSTNRALLKKPVTFDSLKLAKTDIGAKQIYTGSIKKKELISLELKMWLADTYTINSEEKSFEIMVGVGIIE